jgi:hypothetical protein
VSTKIFYKLKSSISAFPPTHDQRKLRKVALIKALRKIYGGFTTNLGLLAEKVIDDISR